MKTLFRIIRNICMVFLIFYGLHIWGYKHSKDSDYYIVLPEIPQDTMPPAKKLFKPKDTTPYKGNWVDIQ